MSNAAKGIGNERSIAVSPNGMDCPMVITRWNPQEAIEEISLGIFPKDIARLVMKPHLLRKPLKLQGTFY